MFYSGNYPESIGGLSSPETGLFIQYVQAHGPVENRLYSRFAHQIANAPAALTMSPDEVITSGVASNSSGRPRNEDSSVALYASFASEHTSIPVILAAVADGMGGQADGDVAGAIAIQMLIETVVDALQDSLHPERLTATNIEHLLLGVINDAHEAIQANTQHGGTTLTCALLAGDVATLAHVGDSRAYLLDFVGGQIHPLTHDHTFAYRMAEAGLITEREAAHHPQSHVIYHAIGVAGRCEADIVRCPLSPGMGILLVSDGVWRPLSPEDIYEVVCQTAHPQEACEQLIGAALSGGGTDDATAVLVRMPEGPSVALASLSAQAPATVEESPAEAELAA